MEGVNDEVNKNKDPNENENNVMKKPQLLNCEDKLNWELIFRIVSQVEEELNKVYTRTNDSHANKEVKIIEDADTICESIRDESET